MNPESITEPNESDLNCMMSKQLIIECTLCSEQVTSDDYGESEGLPSWKSRFSRALIKKGWRKIMLDDEEHICCESCSQMSEF